MVQKINILNWAKDQQFNKYYIIHLISEWTRGLLNELNGNEIIM